MDLCEARLILIRAKFYFESFPDDYNKHKQCLDDLIKASNVFDNNECF